MLNGVITSTYLYRGSTNPPPPLTNMLNLIIASTYLHKGSTNPQPPVANIVNLIVASTDLHKGRWYDGDGDGDGDEDDHGSHIHLHIESPPTWHFKNTQAFLNSGAVQRQGCTAHVFLSLVDGELCSCAPFKDFGRAMNDADRLHRIWYTVIWSHGLEMLGIEGVMKQILFQSARFGIDANICKTIEEWRHFDTSALHDAGCGVSGDARCSRHRLQGQLCSSSVGFFFELKCLELRNPGLRQVFCPTWGCR